MSEKHQKAFQAILAMQHVGRVKYLNEYLPTRKALDNLLDTVTQACQVNHQKVDNNNKKLLKGFQSVLIRQKKRRQRQFRPLEELWHPLKKLYSSIIRSSITSSKNQSLNQSEPEQKSESLISCQYFEPFVNVGHIVDSSTVKGLISSQQKSKIQSQFQKESKEEIVLSSKNKLKMM